MLSAKGCMSHIVSLLFPSKFFTVRFRDIFLLQAKRKEKRPRFSNESRQLSNKFSIIIVIAEEKEGKRNIVIKRVLLLLLLLYFFCFLFFFYSVGPLVSL
uniref:Transmembrane protein n=1 Tax=Cacopsylla melanoneura TaxID=428564 RepID=A0A8D8WK16_9HEMI